MIKRSFEEIQRYFAQFGYSLLSTQYCDPHSLLKYKCPEGHIGQIRWTCFQQGSRCAQCAHEVRSCKTRTPFDFIKSKFKTE